jgi:hypothetical protein
MLFLPLVAFVLPCGDASTPGASLDCPNPTAEWSLVWRGRFNRDFALDVTRNSVVVGYFYDTFDFDPSAGMDVRTAIGMQDAFVSKMLADGSYAWTRTLGGGDAETANGVVATGNGVLLVGSFRGPCDFDPSEGVDERTPLDDPTYVGPEYNAYVTLLDADGSYGWTATFGGGLGETSSRALDRDRNGYVVVVGSFYGSVDFDPGPNAEMHASVPVSNDPYVLKLDADGSFLWARTFGGPGFDVATDVAVDAAGDVFVIGVFRGTADFDPTDGVDLHTQQGFIDDIYLTKLHADGSYAWTYTWPAVFRDDHGRFSLDSDGNVVLTGGFAGTVDFDPGPGVDLHASPVGAFSAFVTKIHGDGSYGWTRSFPCTYQAYGYDVIADASGAVLAVGGFQGVTDFDPTAGVDERTPAGSMDCFLTRLTSDGLREWTLTYGSVSGDNLLQIALDATGGAVVSGAFRALIDLDPGCAEQGYDSPGTYDYFLSKLSCRSAAPDTDGDGDVDLLDVAEFQSCFSGPSPTTCEGRCYGLDLDADDDIDATDFAALDDLLLGPH